MNIHLAMMAWNLLFLGSGHREVDASQSPEWNRGKYLVDGVAHCSTCHEPCGFLMQELSKLYLGGAQVGPWYAPNTTSDAALASSRIRVSRCTWQTSNWLAHHSPALAIAAQFPQQLTIATPSLHPPSRAQPTPETNSKLDRNWGQGQPADIAGEVLFGLTLEEAEHLTNQANMKYGSKSFTDRSAARPAAASAVAVTGENWYWVGIIEMGRRRDIFRHFCSGSG